MIVVIVVKKAAYATYFPITVMQYTHVVTAQRLQANCNKTAIYGYLQNYCNNLEGVHLNGIMYMSANKYAYISTHVSCAYLRAQHEYERITALANGSIRFVASVSNAREINDEIKLSVYSNAYFYDALEIVVRDKFHI